MGRSSASWTSKFYGLKQAAKESGYAMLCNPSDPDREQDCTVEEGRVSLSIAPYAELVAVWGPIWQSNMGSLPTTLILVTSISAPMILNQQVCAWWAICFSPLTLIAGTTPQKRRAIFFCERP